MRLILPFIFVLFCFCQAPAQLYLQMERYGKAEVTKFSPGTEITFRLKGEKEWQSAVLDRILPEENRILLGIHYLDPAQIDALRSFHTRRWSKPLGTQLYIFGGAWTGISLGASIVDKNDPYGYGDAIVTATALGVGFLIKKIFHHRTYRMGEKRWLRILDMRVYNE